MTKSLRSSLVAAISFLVVSLFSFNSLSVAVEADKPVGIKHSTWEGYEQLSFTLAERDCILVLPHKVKAGRPWIWRTEYFGAYPGADLALLKLGYHIAYMDVHDMHADPAVYPLLDRFHAAMVSHHKLSSKVVLEGFSSGGMLALGWAGRQPDKVAAMYLDAPVCDLKACREDWEETKAAMNLSESQARKTLLNPIDHLQPIASARIPILAICGDADTTCPMPKQILVLQKRLLAMGLPIRLIVRPGVGHHPHSLEDPAPIVDFIQQATEAAAAPKKAGTRQ